MTCEENERKFTVHGSASVPVPVTAHVVIRNVGECGERGLHLRGGGLNGRAVVVWRRK